MDRAGFTGVHAAGRGRWLLRHSYALKRRGAYENLRFHLHVQSADKQATTNEPRTKNYARRDSNRNGNGNGSSKRSPTYARLALPPRSEMNSRMRGKGDISPYAQDRQLIRPFTALHRPFPPAPPNLWLQSPRRRALHRRRRRLRPRQQPALPAVRRKRHVVCAAVTGVHRVL